MSDKRKIKEKNIRDMNFSQQIKKSNTDEWFTPKEAVKMIVPYLRERGYQKILCPFDLKESEFVKVLTAEGFNVTYGHIKTGQDFFERNDLHEYDAIVSNPPFSKRQKILEKLFESGAPFAMILDFNGLFDSKARWELFRDNPFELLIPLGRLHFFNEDCTGKHPNFQSIFVCRGMSNKTIEFMAESPAERSEE